MIDRDWIVGRLAMPTEYKRIRCPTCHAIRRADRNAPDDLMHLALTFLTGGLWLGVWVWRATTRDPWRCGVCGRNLGGRTRTPLWVDVLAVVILAAIVAVGLALWIAAAAGQTR
ncbi:MAG: hypothetical protein QGH15_21425 [Kiritimatiellia bacterium]|jgi:hypothetical protein|nr:hypothetical protein [Kiritimatiellia bacterium]